MKNWMKGLLAGILVLGLSACGSVAEPKTDTTTGEKVELKNESKLTAIDVYQKAMKVSEDQKSMHAKMNINQVMKVPSEEHEMKNIIKMDMDMVLDPLAMHQKMSMSMGDDFMDMEMYVTEDGFYMSDAASGEWLKLPNEMHDVVLSELGNEADPTLDMKMFKNFADDFKFEQTDNEYILTLVASGDRFSELFKEVALDNIPAGLEMDEDEAELMESLEMKSLAFKIYIDKETFYTNAFDMDMDMIMSIEGEEVHLTQQINAKLSKINEIEKIEIPQDIIDNAMDIEDLGL